MGHPPLRVARGRMRGGGHTASRVLAGSGLLAAAGALLLEFGGDTLPAWSAPATLACAALALLAGAWLQRRAEREDERLEHAVAHGLAHAVRTPLAQLRMGAESLLAGRAPSPEDRERALLDVETGARRLSRAVENAVTVSTLGRTGLVLLPRPVDLGALVEDAVADLAESARARGVALRADPPAGVVVQADATALRLAVDNLIDNALRHAGGGREVAATVSVDAGRRALLCITDGGPGVDPRARGSIWRPYARLSAPGEPERHGGLGLAVVRAVARGHGGDAWLEDPPAGGARFCLSLPVTSAPVPSPPRLAVLVGF